MTDVLAHDRLGTGPPLVLVHGLGSFRGMWAPVLDRLAAQREVVAVDLPGFGESPPLPAGDRPTPARLAAAVAATAAALGLDRPHLAGSSLGGWVALELARSGTARSATTLSPAGLWRGATPWAPRLALHALRGAAGRLAPVAPTVTRNGAARRAVTWLAFQHGERMTPAQATAALDNLGACHGFWPTYRELVAARFVGGESITVPVSVAWGEHDKVLPWRTCAWPDELPIGSRWQRLAGCGHVSTFDDPGAVAEVLLAGSAG